MKKIIYLAMLLLLINIVNAVQYYTVPTVGWHNFPNNQSINGTYYEDEGTGDGNDDQFWGQKFLNLYNYPITNISIRDQVAYGSNESRTIVLKLQNDSRVNTSSTILEETISYRGYAEQDRANWTKWYNFTVDNLILEQNKTYYIYLDSVTGSKEIGIRLGVNYYLYDYILFYFGPTYVGGPSEQEYFTRTFMFTIYQTVPDTDEDMIVDIYDSCINDPENYNGYQDSDGCPDVVPCVQNWVANWTTCGTDDMQYNVYYDLNSCNNNTGKPLDESQSCDYCIPSIVSSNSLCSIIDEYTETFLDENDCFAQTNLPSDDIVPVPIIHTCDYCTPSIYSVNSSCGIDDLFTQTFLDNNNCFAQTGLPSDNISPPIQNICDYCTPVITSSNTSCDPTNIFTQTFTDNNSCFSLTNLPSDNIPSPINHSCTYVAPTTPNGGGSGGGGGGSNDEDKCKLDCRAWGKCINDKQSRMCEDSCGGSDVQDWRNCESKEIKEKNTEITDIGDKIIEDFKENLNTERTRGQIISDFVHKIKDYINKIGLSIKEFILNLLGKE